MSDLSVTVAQLPSLSAVLNAIAPLQPSPEPKGRYVLGKAVPVVTIALERHEATMAPMLDDFVTRDAEDKPIYKEQPDGRRVFTIRSDKMDAWIAIQAEEVVLPGVRQITRAELGACPITVEQEMVLVSCGLLSDEEPA